MQQERVFLIDANKRRVSKLSMESKDMRLDALIKTEERLAVFGVGTYAKKLCEYYGEEHIKKNVELFIVSDKSKTSEQFMNIKIEQLDGEESREYSDVVVIAALSKNNRLEVEPLLRKKFKRVIFLEEFMDMSYFGENSSKSRDKNIADYYDHFMKKKPLFKYVEIETINRCNGECDFCPVNKYEEQRQYAKMPDKLFYKIIDELKTLKYEGRVALFSNNEAFLDKRIIDFAKYAKNNLPKAYIYITSNGTLISKDIFHEIIPYLDGLNIDVYKSDMREEDPQNIKEIVELAEVLHIKEKIRVSRINKHAIRSSRGGNSPNSKVSYTIKDKCPLLLVQMVIRPDGKVSLCCNDALGTVTLGDITKQTMTDIWYGERYNDYRLKLIGGRNNINLCRYCDFIDMREI